MVLDKVYWNFHFAECQSFTFEAKNSEDEYFDFLVVARERLLQSEREKAALLEKLVQGRQ
jgi:hypothetical protein